MRAGSPSRLLAESPSVLFIVYAPGADAEPKGHEPWLAATDNPFFNAMQHRPGAEAACWVARQIAAP